MCSKIGPQLSRIPFACGISRCRVGTSRVRLGSVAFAESPRTSEPSLPTIRSKFRASAATTAPIDLPAQTGWGRQEWNAYNPLPWRNEVASHFNCTACSAHFPGRLLGDHTCTGLSVAGRHRKRWNVSLDGMGWRGARWNGAGT